MNERYRLAGGFDTPGLLATGAEDGGAGAFRNHEFRRGVRDMDGASSQQDSAPRGAVALSGPLARERNGVARLPSSPNGSEHTHAGWTSFAFNLVGRVFSFSSGVIRGFYAGGGKGYEFQPSSPCPPNSCLRPQLQRESTPVPGAWQEDEFLGDFEQENANSPSLAANTNARPSNKRRQTDRDTWVLVGTPDLTAAEPLLSPKRKPASNSAPRNSRPATASRASTRRSLAPMSRRQSSFVSQTGSPAQILQQPQRMDPTERCASFAPTRRPNSCHGSANGMQPSGHAGSPSYISPEAERFLKRQAKQDKVADKAMSSMSKRLEDLIRQGQEALGTKFSVEGSADSMGGMDTDEGFVDEDMWQ